MNIATRYIIRRVTATVSVLWLILTMLIIMLELLANLSVASLSLALLQAALNAPRLALETLPFACAIGAATALRRMEENRELQVMRAAGMSLKYLTMAAAGGGLAFSLALLTLSEIVLEPAETVARAARGDFSANDGIWLQNKDSYFHAKQLKANGNMSDITIYRPTEDQLMVLRASAAIRQGNSWKLINGNMTTLNRGDNSFTAPSMQHRTFVSRGWDFPAAATAAALKAVARRPREMSMRSLLIAVTLEKNSGGTQFIGALWKRLWSLPAPLLLAASGVWFVGHTRRRRILATALAATGMVGAYYFSAILCAQLATLLRLPLINALPTLLLIGIIFVGARRRFA